jgi:glucosamine-6-phosphate deaminase
MNVRISRHAEEASLIAAGLIREVLRKKPTAVLGLAAGNTPLLLYRELIRMHREEGLDFSRVTTFNLDEYIGLTPIHPQSYHAFMESHLFAHLNLRPENVHVPDGMAENPAASCRDYDQAIEDAGGMDLQILGIGVNGHIGFNEPAASFSPRTCIQRLAWQTLRGNARVFGGDLSRVPRTGITLGIKTILEARMIILLAFGSKKATAVAAMVEGPVTPTVPASVLQEHPHVRIFLDEAAGSALKENRVALPPGMEPGTTRALVRWENEGGV